MKKFARLAVIVVAPLVAAVLVQPPERHQPSADREQTQAGANRLGEDELEGNTVKVHYLEIVTPCVQPRGFSPGSKGRR